TVSLQVAPFALDKEKVGPSVIQIYRPQTPQSPAWSPDGKLLAYVGRSANNRVHIAIREIASGRSRELYPPLAYIPRLQWFPDRRSLFVDWRHNKTRWMTLRISVENGQQTPLVSDAVDLGQLSPDGSKAYDT